MEVWDFDMLIRSVRRCCWSILVEFGGGLGGLGGGWWLRKVGCMCGGRKWIVVGPGE